MILAIRFLNRINRSNRLQSNRFSGIPALFIMAVYAVYMVLGDSAVPAHVDVSPLRYCVIGGKFCIHCAGVWAWNEK